MEQTREQKLETAFSQFIEDVFKMRMHQKDWFHHKAGNMTQKRQYWENIVDESLSTMGIAEIADCKIQNISFIQKSTANESQS